MKILENLTYNNKILIELYKQDNKRLYLEKSHFKHKGVDQYFIKCYTIGEKNQLICQGYIYFYLDLINKESSYIGTYVKEEYRNLGIASLLTSSWIRFCLDNNIYNLKTTHRQRKPFLLYLLKTYSFELKNLEEYKISKHKIDICRKSNDDNKYLYFHNPLQKNEFYSSTILKGDNYLILDKITPDIAILDTVLLSIPHYLKDNEYAYNKSLRLVKGLE